MVSRRPLRRPEYGLFGAYRNENHITDGAGFEPARGFHPHTLSRRAP